jgi:hypothetical protein
MADDATDATHTAHATLDAASRSLALARQRLGTLLAVARMAQAARQKKEAERLAAAAR